MLECIKIKEKVMPQFTCKKGHKFDSELPTKEKPLVCPVCEEAAAAAKSIKPPKGMIDTKTAGTLADQLAYSSGN